MTGLPSTCKAVVLHEFGEQLKIEDVKMPEHVEPGAVLVKSEMVTICGTDIHFWLGEVAGRSEVKLPTIPGHESVGRVAKLGEGVTHDSVGQPLKEGDRIIWTHGRCGSCYFCTVLHEPTLCPNSQLHSKSSCHDFPYVLGRFSEYCYVVPTAGRIKVPDEVSSAVASAASCALRSVVHGYDRLGRLSFDDMVVVQGAGPIGLFALAMAVAAGVAKTILIGAPARRLTLAQHWGATHTINMDEVPDPAKRRDMVLEMTEGRGADVVMECSGGATAFTEGLELARRDGRYLIIGQWGSQKVSFDTSTVVKRQLDIIGVLSGHTDHYYRALEFMKNNAHRFSFDEMISNRYRFADTYQAFQSMKALKEIKPVIVF
ncbi:MAG: zinc-binding dehydrogenase [Chloroflexota bacterium]